jgi:hypothetical protein
VARLFDPLQLLAPYVIRAKIILQQAWIAGLGWDEPFPSQMENQVKVWVDELPQVAQFIVPRCHKKDIIGKFIYIKIKYTIITWPGLKQSINSPGYGNYIKKILSQLSEP